MPTATRVVVIDANVLINLMHVERLELLGTLPAYIFVVPDHVVAEITDFWALSRRRDMAKRLTEVYVMIR